MLYLCLFSQKPYYFDQTEKCCTYCVIPFPCHPKNAWQKATVSYCNMVYIQTGLKFLVSLCLWFICWLIVSISVCFMFYMEISLVDSLEFNPSNGGLHTISWGYALIHQLDKQVYFINAVRIRDPIDFRNFWFFSSYSIVWHDHSHCNFIRNNGFNMLSVKENKVIYPFPQRKKFLFFNEASYFTFLWNSWCSLSSY